MKKFLSLMVLLPVCVLSLPLVPLCMVIRFSWELADMLSTWLVEGTEQ